MSVGLLILGLALWIFLVAMLAPLLGGRMP